MQAPARVNHPWRTKNVKPRLRKKLNQRICRRLLGSVSIQVNEKRFEVLRILSAALLVKGSYAIKNVVVVGMPLLDRRDEFLNLCRIYVLFLFCEFYRAVKAKTLGRQNHR